VTDQQSVDRAIREIVSEHSGLDILLNNAGILIDKSHRPTETDLAIIRETFETNMLGPLRLSQAVIPMMKKNHYGRIVNVSSSAGSFESMAGSNYSPAYSLSKAALNALTIMLSTELKGTNILVNSMDPGWVRSDMGGPRAPRSLEEGADTAVWLATLPDGGPSGGFFRDRKKAAW
jgi:NAD(P)-dependent dehydrogenase (short-subunit alcohol dehydrogenase family)